MSGEGGRSGCRGEAGTIGGRDLRGWRTVRCAACGLPAERCLCATLPRVETVARVVLVTHRVELLRASNSARLVAAMLPRASIIVRGAMPGAVRPEGRGLLLFPFEHARLLRADDRGGDLTLVVPDGTWSQARRIARRDPLCRDTPAVTLPSRDSGYALRRNPRPGALCTLEAVAEALGTLEGAGVAAAMLAAFARWRDAHLALRAGQ